MGNVKSGLGLGLIKINLNNREEVKGEFINIISVDNDLSENEDYFREDTLKLGFENEAERLVEEATKGKKFNTIDKFEKVFEEVFGALTKQEYFCVCDYEVEDLGGGIIMLAYAYGGNYDW